MQEYLHLFETATAEQAAYTGSTYMEPWVSCVSGATGATFNKKVKTYNATAYRVNGSSVVGGGASYTFTATDDLRSVINGTTYMAIPTGHTTFYTWADMDYVETPKAGNTASLASATAMTRSRNLWLFPETAITGTTLTLLIRAVDGYKWHGDNVISDV